MVLYAQYQDCKGGGYFIIAELMHPWWVADG